MTWFESYLLWSITSFKGLLIGLGLTGVVFVIISWLNYAMDCDFDDRKDKKRISFCSHCTKLILPFAIPILILGIMIPNTTTLLKIIATKKGVDAVQTQTFQGYVDKSATVIDNSLKFLNQEIEKKLDKKEVK